MAVKELTEIIGLSAIRVAVAIAVRVVITLIRVGVISVIRVTVRIAVDVVIASLIEFRFLCHERVRVLADLVANSRMLPQILLQGRMALQELVVQHEVGLFAKLVGGFAMAIEEPIELGHVAAVSAAQLGRSPSAQR